MYCMIQVLIIDDEPAIALVLKEIVESEGARAKFAQSLELGLSLARDIAFDLVFLDVLLPDGNGIEAMAELKACPGTPTIIVITGSHDREGLALAMENGAWDYMLKPFRLQEVKHQARQVFEYRKKKKGAHGKEELKRERIIGSSPALEASLARVAQAASTNVNVLLTGETGTGKELFARVLHDNSLRSQGPYVVLDCSVLPENLIESSLFGHEKGAFTGAEKKRAGLVMQADKGTLFLDEIGELPLGLQRRFLRVLQEKSFRPVGADREISSNFRLVAATNRNLSLMVAQGSFREDLFFRLQAFQINIPPLQKRRSDIQDIAIYHLACIFQSNEMETKGASPDFFEALKTYDWPGNVRELVNALESAVAASAFNQVLFPVHLPGEIRLKLLEKKMSHENSGNLEISSGREEFPTLKTARQRAADAAEARYLHDLLQLSGGNNAEACRLSGIKRTRLWQLLKKHHLS